MAAIFDGRWIGDHGIGRFARELRARLPVRELEAPGRPMSPLDPLRLARLPAGAGDWLLSPGYNAPLAGALPYVFTIHDLNHIDRPDNSSAAKRLYYRLVLRRLCLRARAVLTVSDYSRRRIAAWSGVPVERVFDVGNGVSSVFRPDGERHRPGYDYVLCVGNRRGHKNEEGLVRAFARAGLPAQMRLVLTGDPTPALAALAAACGIGERLAFAGRVDEEGLARLYRGARLLSFPSFYEGFGLPVVEAFACGTPVLTSNVTSLPEIAGDAACLVDPASDDAIAAGLARLHADEGLRATLVARGLARAPQYSWDAVTSRVRDAVRAADTRPGQPLAWD